MGKRRNRYAEAIQQMRQDYDILESRLRQTEEVEDKLRKELAEERKYSAEMRKYDEELSEWANRPRFLQLKFRGVRKGTEIRETFEIFTVQLQEGHYFTLTPGYTDIEVDAREVS